MRTNPANSICPHCRQRAPIVLRGIEPRCTACGGRRQPFGSQTLTLAGKPSRIGGTVASAAGWIALVGGLSAALFFGVLLHTVWPGTLIGWAFAVPTAVISLIVGLLLIRGGRRWQKQGIDAERSVKLDAVRALAAHRGGSLTSEQVSEALQVSDEEGDALLTELAKDPKLGVSIDVDDDGVIHYLFGVPERRWRILEEAAARGELGREGELREVDPELADRRLRR
ncbi:MAG TPA: hypothetical protein VIM73_05385 [Polyangiaceae bacterium]